ncbi:MAG TPA: hypothetical protein VEL05_07245 [Candidatus Acidoferrum sp.]|nr:hypothetical protein [Candidatus Acidoferrum sp.]
MMLEPMLILVAGPYRSGTDDEPDRIAANLRAMNEVALILFRRGHLPITGEAIALPLIALAGSTRTGDAAFDEIFHPLAERLVQRCDACLRIGGASRGADEMVRIARESGRRVFHSADEVPDLRP